MRPVLYVGTTMLLVLPMLRNMLTGEPITTGTLAVTLRDQAGDELAGTWPVTMAYGDFYDGHSTRQGWYAKLDPLEGVRPGQHVDADVEADLGVLGTAHVSLELEVVELHG